MNFWINFRNKEKVKLEFPFDVFEKKRKKVFKIYK
jgi:hypothetical protein